MRIKNRGILKLGASSTISVELSACILVDMGNLALVDDGVQIFALLGRGRIGKKKPLSSAVYLTIILQTASTYYSLLNTYYFIALLGTGDR